MLGETTESRRLLLGGLITICCLGFLIVDVAAAGLFDDAFPALVCTNIVTAQLTLICVWGTLVRGTFWIRLPWTLLLMVLSWCGFAWGISWETSRAESMLGVGILWSFGFVVSFVPLKIAAALFRWQIVQSSSAADHRKSYAIRDIMIGTMLLAVVMALGKAMLPDEPVTFFEALHSSGLDEPEPLLAISLFGVVSLLVKLPCIWIALAAKTSEIKRYIVIWCGYCFVLTIVELFLLTAIIGSFEPELATGMVVGHQVMGAIVLAVCLALRGLGYRLKRPTQSTDIEPLISMSDS